MLKLEKIPLILLIISIIWSISIILAPATLKPETIIYLDGRANMFDYQQKWSALPIPHRFIYTIGDLQCHQNYNRSYIINSNQMPVCTRDVGIFFGCNIGIALVFLVDVKLSPTRAFLNLFVKKNRIEKIKDRRNVVLGILVLAALPLLIDGFVQYISNYESTNEIRLITGLLVGIVYSFGVAVLISSTWYRQ
jgi:uncharacterized membrane protein